MMAIGKTAKKKCKFYKCSGTGVDFDEEKKKKKNKLKVVLHTYL